MMTHVVGIGDIVVVTGENDRIVTHALGSCVAVTFHSKKPLVSAMIHIALPNRPKSSADNTRRGYYADEGLEYLISILENQYAFSFKNYEIKIIGGANPSKSNDVFKIGQRNLEAVAEVLNRYRLTFHELEVGGFSSRTVEMDTSNGQIFIKRQPLII